GKFRLDMGKTTGKPGAFWRWAFADLVYLPGQQAEVLFDLIEPLGQFDILRGGALLRPDNHCPVALVRDEPPLPAPHRKRLPVRGHRDPIAACMLALRGKPVARLEPPVLDRCPQVVRDALVGGPRVAGIRQWHCISLRCPRPPGPERR